MSGTGILWLSSGEDSASTAGGMGLIPDLGTKILHATHHGQKKKSEWHKVSYFKIGQIYTYLRA